MDIQTLKQTIQQWRLTRERTIYLIIGLSALLIYEFLARPYYRPFIYKHNYFDFHIADTLGNSLGTFAAIFIFLFALGGETSRNQFVTRTVIISVVLFELTQPVMGKPIDFRDVGATIISGIVSLLIVHVVHRKNN